MNMVNKKAISEEKIRAYALKNAAEHEGKAVIGSVMSGLFAEGLKREDAKDTAVKVSMIVNEINKLPFETQKEEFAKLDKTISHRDVRDQEELPELEGVDEKKGIITRFSPSSSASAFHIGHILTEEF